MSASVVIPTLNAERFIGKLLERLFSQTVKFNEIVVIDSESTDKTVEIAKTFDGVTVLNVERRNFNHGGTRDVAFQKTTGDIILCLTQDALPVDENYAANLIAPFAEDENVAMSSGRQIARDDAPLTEKLNREFNYPEHTFVRSKEDLPCLGVKTFFSSDCCSAYRRTAYNAIGGFDKDILVNEDMKIAAQFIFSGYKIAYVGSAGVLHSHNYSLWQQFTRNFDVAAFMKMNNDLFGSVSAASEGVKMVKWIIKRLLKGGHLFSAVYYVVECATKLLANKLGSRYKSLSKKNRIRFALNKNYWRTHD
ncbi:MAG: glycosyltransferase [Fibrobacter sp.]|nr:glycosyltransferase [Fibrobacter sp.]